jgi:PAS domain S-box-containing protein
MSNVSNPELLHNFLAGLRENELVEKLLENLPNDIYFFVKDTQGRFMMANRLFWEKMGLTHGDQIIGKTDYDFFWTLQAEAYLHDDAEVLRTGVSQINKLEIIPTADGLVDWYRTTKIPIRGIDGNFAGLVGVTHDLRGANTSLQPYRTMEPVIRYIMEHFAEPVHARDLAEVAGTSLPRFTRRFKREFQVTPGRYIAMVRLNVACRLLASNRKPIAEIALESGFYDHSFFTKQFVKYKGMTPKEFRTRFRDMPDQKRFFPLGMPEMPVEDAGDK